MCGICGELRFDGQIPDLASIRVMRQRLARRGPDYGADYSDGPVALGHQRLAIIDLSAQGNQPMIDSALGLTLVFNGTIYNYPMLKKELQAKGYQFFSNSDSEVIIKAYAAWGAQCVEHLNGMFAFAIWDSQAQHLFLARDRLGIKPLYFSHSANTLRFASNTQALLTYRDIDTRIDPVGLHHQLTLHAVIPAPHTLLQGIRKLPPGHTMTIDAHNNTKLRHYWQLSPRSVSMKTERAWQEAITDALSLAVKRRIEIADVPVGVLLSGGLDSSLLVALLARSGIAHIKTFTIGFEDQPEEKGSEYEYSDAVVARFNTDHHKITIANDQVLARLPEAVDNMAEPMVAQDAIAFYLLAEQVAKQVKVVQSGQGADEVFGGYFWYPQMQQASGSDLMRFAPYYFDRDHNEWLKTIASQYHTDDVTSQLITQRLAEATGADFIDRVLHMDVTMLIVDDPVKRVDNMTMAWGLEARVPFLDYELVELAAAMPATLKLKGGGKYILKQIARGLIPDSVIDRPKGYFPLPALKYVRGPFLDFMREILNSHACQQRGLYQRDYIDKLLAKPERYLTPIKGNKLWHLALLELWLQRHVDNP